MGLLSGGGNAAYKSVERTNFVATAAQTTFTITNGYSVGDTEVFLNGVKLIEGDDYFAVNGTTVVLSAGAAAGDVIQVVSYNQFIAANTYTKNESDSRYMVATGQTPMSSYLRTPNYGISSYSDSATASLEASANGAGEQGVGIKAFGRSVATTGGDILYTADSRGAGGRHRFGYWNGTTFTSTLTIDSSGRMNVPNQPACLIACQAADINWPTGGIINYGGNGANPSTKIFDTTNSFNMSNSRYTAPLTGTYFIGATANGQSGSVPRAHIRINGNSVGNGIHFRGNSTLTSGGDLHMLTFSAVYKLNAGDYVDVYVFQGQFDTFGSNYFSAYMVG